MPGGTAPRRRERVAAIHGGGGGIRFETWFFLGSEFAFRVPRRCNFVTESSYVCLTKRRKGGSGRGWILRAETKTPKATRVRGEKASLRKVFVLSTPDAGGRRVDHRG